MWTSRTIIIAVAATAVLATAGAIAAVTHSGTTIVADADGESAGDGKGVSATGARVGGEGDGDESSSEGAVIDGECSVPSVTDRYLGFVVGKPAGWSLNAAGGAVIVRKDPAGGELALIYPVRTKRKVTALRVFEQYTAVLRATAQAQGGGLSFELEDPEADLVQGDVTGSFAGNNVRGRFFVTPLEEQTVFATYWAPAEAFTAEQDTLEGIVRCYSKRLGVAMRVYRGSYFSASMPEDWQVSAESTNGIDLIAPRREAGVSSGWVGQVPGVGDPATFREVLLTNVLPLQDVRVVATQDLGTTTDGLGITWSVQAAEIDAILEGRPVHGIITTTTGDAGYGQYVGMYSTRLAEADEWDEYASVLAAVHESVQLINVQVPGGGVELPASDPTDSITSTDAYTSQVDENFEGWSEATLGFETVQSPSTGTLYDVPLNNWDPAAGGYVRQLPGGGTELLEDY